MGERCPVVVAGVIEIDGGEGFLEVVEVVLGDGVLKRSPVQGDAGNPCEESLEGGAGGVGDATVGAVEIVGGALVFLCDVNSQLSADGDQAVEFEAEGVTLKDIAAEQTILAAS